MSERPYCETCNNTGWIDCYCGGDLCICENYGEEPCPHCDGWAEDAADDGQPDEAQEWRDYDPHC